MRPSIRQLEYLVALAEHRHFGRAADACHVTQPALSAQMKALEEQVGAPLFERGQKGVLPTAAGTAAATRARDVLAAVDELLAAARGAAAPLSGPLRLGAIPTVAPYLFPRVLPALRRAFPALELLLVEERTETLVAMLQEGRLDAAVLAHPVPGDGLVERELARDEFALCVPKGHRLVKRKRVHERDLEDEVVLLLDDGHCLRDQALSVCSRVGAHESANVRASSLPTLLQMVAGGLGVTLLPELAVTSGGLPREIATVPFARPRPGRTLVLAWRGTSPRGAELALLADRLRP